MELIVNRASPDFDFYLNLVIAIGLAKGGRLNIAKFKQEVKCIKISFKNNQNIIAAVHVFFGKKVKPESVVDVKNSDIKIKKAKEQPE